MTTIANLDDAATRLGMPVIEMDRNTWRTLVAEWNAVIGRAVTAERDLDGARNLIARAEISMRERAVAHTATKTRANELAAQVGFLADALRNVLYDDTVTAHRHAAAVLHTINATTRTTR